MELTIERVGRMAEGKEGTIKMQVLARRYLAALADTPGRMAIRAAGAALSELLGEVDKEGMR